MPLKRYVNNEMHASFLAALALVLITLLMCWAYLPGIDGPALLDDRPNIPSMNPAEIDLSEASAIVFGNGSGPLGRPVAMATFVGEALLWGASPSTGKAVNLVLHLVNTVLVYLLILAVLRAFGSFSPRASACLAAALWCWAPLQLSTVLYHVQRMTLLCSFFMLLTLLFALRWRECFESASRRHFVWGVAALCTAVLAVFSKENAATLILIVPALLALHPKSSASKRGEAMSVAFSRIFALLVLLIGGVLILQWFWIVEGYQVRDHTVMERALSQPRIVFDYLQQFFLPQTSRLGLVHDDFSLSTGLLSPPATLLSLLFFVAWVLLGFWQRSNAAGKQLLLCAAIFLLGHAVESTVLALEPYFEHRNYFPGVGLVLGVAFALSASLKKAPAIKVPILVWLFSYAGSLLVETGAQAMVWSKYELIVLQDVNSHPKSPRANRAMALLLAQSQNLDLALEYSDKAYPSIAGERSLDGVVFATALSCLSGQTLLEPDIRLMKAFSGLNDRAAREAMQLVIDRVYEDSCDESTVLALADRLQALAKSTPITSEHAPLLSTVALLENALGRYERALWYTDQAMSQAPQDIQLMLMNLHFCVAVQGIQGCVDKLRKLRTIEASGRFSPAQSETLALYKVGE